MKTDLYILVFYVRDVCVAAAHFFNEVTSLLNSSNGSTNIFTLPLSVGPYESSFSKLKMIITNNISRNVKLKRLMLHLYTTAVSYTHLDVYKRQDHS